MPRFIKESIRTGAPAEYYKGARAIGPLAMFEGADTSVDHPYKNGVVLTGDAASASDPSWGQGLSLTARDIPYYATICLLTRIGMRPVMQMPQSMIGTSTVSRKFLSSRRKTSAMAPDQGGSGLWPAQAAGRRPHSSGRLLTYLGDTVLGSDSPAG